MTARWWHGLIALFVAVALVIQLSITFGVSALPPGHAVGTLAGTQLLGRLLRMVSFFTIQSNVLAGASRCNWPFDPTATAPAGG